MNEKSVPILNLQEAPLEEWSHGKRFRARLGSIGRRIGARKPDCRLVVLPPGMKEPDIVEMSDSGKIGIISGSAPGGAPSLRKQTIYLPRSASVEYWEGEK